MSGAQPQLTPRQIIARGIAQRRGIPESEAEAVLALLSKEEGDTQLQTFMNTVKDNAAVIQQLPPDTRSLAMQFMAGASARQPGDDMGDLRKMMREVTVIREAMRGETNGKPDQATQDKLAELSKTLTEMKEAENKRQLEQVQKDFKERLEKMEAGLKEKLDAMAPGTSPEEKSAIVRAVEDIKAWKTAEKDVAEAFGVKPPTGTPEVKISESLESLKKLGYRIEGPKTLDEIQKELTETVKKEREAAVKETEARLRSDDRKMAMVMALGQSALDGILPALIEGAPGAAAPLEAAKAALKAASAGT